MRRLVIISALLALVFQGNAQEGVTWFCRVDSIQSGRFKVKWRAVFPAQSGTQPVRIDRCSLSLENYPTCYPTNGGIVLLHPKWGVEWKGGLPGTVFTVTQEFRGKPGAKSKRIIRGMISYDCTQEGRRPIHCSQPVTFDYP